MRIGTFLALSLCSFNVLASSDLWITVDRDAASSLEKNLGTQEKTKFFGDLALAPIKNYQILKLSHVMHQEFKRCAGFMAHFSKAEALEHIRTFEENKGLMNATFVDYSINQDGLVRSLLPEVSAVKIQGTIASLSNFKNRYYQSPHGQESSQWLANTWQSLSSHRDDVKVELYKHARWGQSSVIMTIEGSLVPDEIIVVGGHADSIAGSFGMTNDSRAPGADDNASGMATITEVIRVLMQSNYRPARTVKFMGYAAEEVGLLGSKEIAGRFKVENKNVIGVMQLDMTNFKGSSDLDIVMMTDFTNKAQNEFLGKLIDHYLQIPWGYSKCGYGCSDHASWTANGFPASIPFEARMNQMNQAIHSTRDTLETLSNNAQHAMKFSKLALAYVAEMAKK